MRRGVGHNNNLSNITSELAWIKPQDPTSDAEADTEPANEINPGNSSNIFSSNTYYNYEDDKVLQFVHSLKWKSNQTDICVVLYQDLQRLLSKLEQYRFMWWVK